MAANEEIADGTVNMLFEQEEHIRQLTHSSWQARKEAARFLGTIGRTEAVGPLIRAATDPIWEVRAAVAEALGKIGDKSAVKTLKLLRNDRVCALTITDDKYACPACLRTLDDDDEDDDEE